MQSNKISIRWIPLDPSDWKFAKSFSKLFFETTHTKTTKSLLPELDERVWRIRILCEWDNYEFKI